VSIWDSYPADYRTREVETVTRAVQAGECVALVGLSGSGKSNLMGFLAHRLSREGRLPGVPSPHPAYVLADCNRLVEPTPEGLFRLMAEALEQPVGADEPAFKALEQAVQRVLDTQPALCLLLDRFDALLAEAGTLPGPVAGGLRALRDAHKYDLTYVTATRRPPEPDNELAELFFAHIVWLGSLNEADARWNVMRYTQRKNLDWDEKVISRILQLSGGYPALLRAVCEAFADGCSLEAGQLAAHPAVHRRVEEFWADHPSQTDLSHSGLAGHPLLAPAQPLLGIDTSRLTAKENLLWDYLQAHPNQVCEKDDLIRAVWTEDRIFERGIRDDSLAQVVRRLREKVEPLPSSPQYIHTVPGRGYRFTP
jgi:energy-coupling factor transporter ATP-binding protein EcfA2